MADIENAKNEYRKIRKALAGLEGLTIFSHLDKGRIPEGRYALIGFCTIESADLGIRLSAISALRTRGFRCTYEGCPGTASEFSITVRKA